MAVGLGFGLAWVVPAVSQETTGRISQVDSARRIMPEETADEPALHALIGWDSMPTFGDGRYRQFDSHDRGTGQPVPIKLFDHGNRDMNNFICAGADASAESSFFVPYTLDQERCPERYVRGFVLARAEGSGRLARVWMTALSLRSGHPGAKVLRIYVDDREKPFIQVPLAAVLGGRAGEIFTPPFAVGMPGVLAWYYPVVFSTKLIVSIDGLDPFDLFYYQTAVVLDASPGSRTAARSRLPARDEARNVLAATDDGPIRSTIFFVPPTTFTLEPGVPVTVADLSGGATIESVRVRVAAADLPALDDIDVSVRWDGEPPAIEHSLAMLLAAALDPPDTSSLALGGTVAGDDVVMTLRLPMPFATRAVWSMTNRGTTPVTLELTIGGEATLPPDPWGRLHTETHVTVGPTSAAYHPVASVSGRGRYLGTCLVLQGHQLPRGTFWADGLNFLEGAMRGWVDGEPAVPGTGTEAYLNASFYLDEGPFGAPFSQAWGIGRDRPTRFGLQHGKVSACRWQVLGDSIDFRSSVEFRYEIGPGDPSLLDRYRSIAFFYR